ncbi:PrgI family protein [Eubacteriales bacterium OttesenSCG-928-N14]|nr:PrgI family protein [Eubacteriales bacterium OttesenSCG-928-N14]
MEVKINREVTDFKETLFFGLDLRQLICCILALGVSVGAFFILRGRLHIEIVTWICIILAAPFVALGFLKYNGMSADKFLIAWVRSEILTPRRLYFKPYNLYYELITIPDSDDKKKGGSDIDTKVL